MKNATYRHVLAIATIAACNWPAVCPSAVASAPATSCESSAAYRALNFSIGTWSVSVVGFSGKATSEIRHEIRGCAVVEQWRGGSDVGMNVDAFNAEDNHWHRFFVDSQGKVHTFEGIVRGNALEYRGTSQEPDGKVYLNRLELRSDGPAKMTERWQKSRDGNRWSTAFEGIYTRVGP